MSSITDPRGRLFLGETQQEARMAGDETRGVPVPREERRKPEERRRYNRRSPASDVAPPYFEAFERIAVALEQIAATMTTRRLDLDAPPPAVGEASARSSRT